VGWASGWTTEECCYNSQCFGHDRGKTIIHGVLLLEQLSSKLRDEESKKAEKIEKACDREYLVEMLVRTSMDQ
jgi:hypothetical protein